MVWLVDTKDRLALDFSGGWPYTLQGYGLKAGRRHLLLRGDPALQSGQDLVGGKFLNVDETIVLAARDGDKGIQWGSPKVRTQQPVPAKITDPNWFVLVWKYGIRNDYGGIMAIEPPNGELRVFASEGPMNTFYVDVRDITRRITGQLFIPQDNWSGQGVWMLVGIAKIDGQYYVVHSHSSQGPIAGPLSPPTQESENFLIGIATGGTTNIWVGGVIFGAFKLTADLVKRIAALGYQNAVAFDPATWSGPPYDFYWPLFEDLRGRPVGDNPMVPVGSGPVTFSSPYVLPRWPDRIRAVQSVVEQAVIRQERGQPSDLALALLPQGRPPSTLGLTPVVHGKVDLPDDLLGWKAVTGQVYDLRLELSRKPYYEDPKPITLSQSVTNGTANQFIGPISLDIPAKVDLYVDIPLASMDTVLVVQNTADLGFIELTNSPSPNYSTGGVTTEVADSLASGGSYIWFSSPPYTNAFVLSFTADQLARVAALGSHVWVLVRMWDVTAPTVYVQRKLGSNFYRVGPEVRMLKVGPNLWMSEAPLPLALLPATDGNIVVSNIANGRVDCVVWGVHLARWVTRIGSDVLDTTSPVWTQLAPLNVVPGATLRLAWSNPGVGWRIPTLGGTLSATWKPRRLSL
jgi:hypothetical protein